MSLIEIHNSPPTPPRTSHSSTKPFDPSPMSSYRYPPATTEVQGSVLPTQYSPAHYTYGTEQQYRAQAPIPPTSSAQLNLPPLRSIDRYDPRQPQSYPPPGSAAPSYGTNQMPGGYAPMPNQSPPMAAGPQYYPGQMTHMAGPYDQPGYNPQLPMMRYPLPMGESSRALQHGRNKKEVKRRTKTGCLTCRKRRIKCDEAQPTCRNCAKSKRECAGYDPMFKPQQNPSGVQPPSSASSASSTAAGHPFVNPGYPVYSQGQSAITNSPSPPFDRPRSTPFVTYPQPEQAHMPERGPTPGMPIKRTRRRPVLELLTVGGREPPQLPPRQPISQHDHERVVSTWFSLYSRGLDKLLDTNWFTQSSTASLLFGEGQGSTYASTQTSTELEWEFVTFLNATTDQMSWSDPSTHSQEARLLWRMFESCRAHRSSAAATGGRNWHEDPALAANRVDVVEALLTGDRLAANPMPAPARYATPDITALPLEAQLQERELEFWHQLGRFVVSSTQRREALDRMRKVLDEIENRDILYSIAICRHWGDMEAPMPSTDNERLEYIIARDWTEAEIERATNPVFSRFCAIAARIWAD